MLLLAIKLLHTLIFFLLSACILYILFCAITNRYSTKTTLAFCLVTLEGLMLVLNDWKCPLTTLSRSLGAENPDVASLFLPPWLAEHIFGVCTPLFISSSALLLIRRKWGQRDN